MTNGCNKNSADVIINMSSWQFCEIKMKWFPLQSFHFLVYSLSHFATFGKQFLFYKQPACHLNDGLGATDWVSCYEYGLNPGKNTVQSSSYAHS